MSTQQPAAPFGRLGVAMVTPFTDDGALDFDGVDRLVDHLLGSGHDLLVVNGTTGESPTTSDTEKNELVARVHKAAAGRASVIAGIGSADTEHTISLARGAAQAGADGLLVVTPYYSKPSQDGLVAHFCAVADATDLPVMLYDIPGRTATPIATATLLRLAEHPRIVAVKDAKGDFGGTAQVLAETELTYYSGSDENNLPLLAIGAAGIVSVVSHVAGAQYAQMLEAVSRGDLVAARAVNARLHPAYRAIMTVVQGAVAAKAAMQLLGILPNRQVRLPQVSMSDEQMDDLRRALDQAGVLG
jgi:4-hydroxy-tetrahydrodipicolinate synthase